MNDSDYVRWQMNEARGDVYNLSGPARKTSRQTLMTAITGERLPKSKCGVNALRAELNARLNFPASCLCIADRNRLIYRWSKGTAADCSGMDPRKMDDD